MSKRLILVMALVFVVGMSFAAYAAVQNVKVSGDINMLGVVRNNFDLNNPLNGVKEDDSSRFFATQTRVRIDADLTDNVMATVRLINERRWDEQYSSADTNNSTINLDLAYVTLKEFLYSPLTLTLGRQELAFGNQLIIGNAGLAARGANLNGLPSDLSENKAFDAIRATLNYDPLVIDAVYAVLQHTVTTTDNDITLMGINAKYDINKKVSAEGYVWSKKTKDKVDGLTDGKIDSVYTVGGLITAKPITDLKMSLEAAYQFGTNGAAMVDDIQLRERKAWALQAMADYTFSKVKFTPSVGAAYTYLSGTKGNNGGDNGRASWDPMFYNQKLGNIPYAILPFTNMQVYNIKAAMKPMDDVTLSAVYGYYLLNQPEDQLDTPTTADYYTMTNRKDLGNSIDITATYDYTEDVQFGLTGGMFIPGKAFSKDASGLDAGVGRRTANQVIASMKVVF